MDFLLGVSVGSLSIRREGGVLSTEISELRAVYRPSLLERAGASPVGYITVPCTIVCLTRQCLYCEEMNPQNARECEKCGASLHVQDETPAALNQEKSL